MNQHQKNQVQGHIDRYFQLNITDLISTSYPSIEEGKVIIGEYTAKEFLSISNKVFNQFSEELKGIYFKALPYQYQFQNEFGGADLNTDLANFISYLESNRFPNALTHLHRLIHYQAINGFWEKSKRKYFRQSEETVNSEKERIELVSKQLEKSTSEFSALLKEIESSKDGLSQFTVAKQKELSEIESLLASARNNSSEISELHTSATSTTGKISSLLDASDEKKSESDELHQDSRETLKQIKSTMKKQEQTLKIQLEDFEGLKSKFEENLVFIESKSEYFIERNGYLDDLIGREVGVSLFETFKQRKGEIGSSIGFWKWSVPVTTIVTIIWIFFLFGNGDLSDLSWQIILINSFKALPVIGLLLFSISQYTKERNFQEEYAFKSAVALTINSYADQLQGKENKDKLIMDSVSSIYRTPLASKTHKDTEEAKTLIKSTKELTDIARSIMPNK